MTWTDGIFEVEWRVLFAASADGVWVNREPQSVRVGIRREGGRGLEEERVNRMTWTRAMRRDVTWSDNWAVPAQKKDRDQRVRLAVCTCFPRLSCMPFLHRCKVCMRRTLATLTLLRLPCT